MLILKAAQEVDHFDQHFERCFVARMEVRLGLPATGTLESADVGMVWIPAQRGWSLPINRDLHACQCLSCLESHCGVDDRSWTSLHLEITPSSEASLPLWSGVGTSKTRAATCWFQQLHLWMLLLIACSRGHTGTQMLRLALCGWSLRWLCGEALGAVAGTNRRGGWGLGGKSSPGKRRSRTPFTSATRID